MKTDFSYTQRHFYLTAAIAFFIPVFPYALPPLIILLALNRLLVGNFAASWGAIPSKNMFFLFISLYLLYLVGQLYSSNLDFGWRDLETKLSLLVFPLVFFFSKPLDQVQSRKVLRAFVLGCIIGFLVCAGWGIFNYMDEKIDMHNGVHRDNFGYYYFFSSRFSPFLHPSYLAMYVVMALLILHFCSRTTSLFRPFTERTFILIFLVFILLLNSKAGILSLLLFGIYFTWYNLWVKKKVWRTLGIIGAFAVVITSLYLGVSEFSYKVNKAFDAVMGRGVDASADESSAKRVMVWSASCEVIKNNWLIGTGTGDSKDELLDVYKERGMMIEYDAKLNSHNQFLQTFISLGIPGLFSFLCLLLVPAYVAGVKRDFLYLFFIFLFIVNISFESMLETQAGVIFFAFFHSWFFSAMVSDRNDSVS